MTQRRSGGLLDDFCEPSMGEVSTIGLDIAKSDFQVHGVDIAGGAVVIRKRVSRAKALEYFGGSDPAWVRTYDGQI
jgi:hypothetical protein